MGCGASKPPEGSGSTAWGDTGSSTKLSPRKSAPPQRDGSSSPRSARGSSNSSPRIKTVALPWEKDQSTPALTPSAVNVEDQVLDADSDLDQYLALIERQESNDSADGSGWDVGATPHGKPVAPAGVNTTGPKGRLSGRAADIDTTPRPMSFCTVSNIGGRSENQDVAFAAQLASGVFVGAVLDGHGGEGKDAAFYAEKRMSSFIKKSDDLKRDPQKALTQGFAAAHKSMSLACDCSFSGATATCAVIQGSRLVMGWVGDSRAVLSSRDVVTGAVRTEAVTRDHRPEQADERARIEDAGGRVMSRDASAPLRCYTDRGAVGLMLTRSLGDLEMHNFGVSAKPELREVEIDPGAEWLVIASDGIFDVLEDAEVTQILSAEYARHGSLEGAANTLVGRACAEWERRPGSDNVTVCVVHFD